MTLDELNELLNIFDMYIVVKDEDVYFYDVKNNTQLDVYRLTTDWKKIEEEKSSSIADLFKGCVFKVIKDDIRYDFQIKYDYNLNTYSFRNLFIQDDEKNVDKIVKITDDPSNKRIEYFVDYHNNKYSYSAVFTKSKVEDWKEAYFDELDLNESKIASKYSVDGNKDNYEIYRNDFDYTKLCKLDPTIIKIINYFDSSICDLLPDLPKIYGLYWPKKFNGGKPFEFENEYSLYHDMNRLYGNYSWNLIIDKENAEESPFSYCIDYKDNEYIIENMIYYTKRFGVSFPEPQVGKHVVCAESLAWYKYFNDYFENILNHGQRDHLGRIIDSFVEEGKDISKYMPKGDWHDLLETDYYLFEILLGHDLNDLKEQAKKEDRIEDLVNAYYQLNNMDLGTLAFKFGPTPYLTNLFEHDYRPTDEELDDLVYKLIINKTKIHGEYCPDDIFADEDVLHIKYLSEPELYNVIKHYNDWKEISYEDFDRWKINKSYTDEDILYAKEFLMYQAKRFGVKFKANYENIPIEESQSYKAWYEFYDNYYNKFSDYDRDKMINKISFKRAENEDFKELIPDGDWRDSLIYGLYWPEDFCGGNPIISNTEYDLIYGLERDNVMYCRALMYDEKGIHEPSNFEYVIEYELNHARNFGVNLPTPEKGKHIVCAESLAWYKFNVDYFWKVLNHSQGDHLKCTILEPFIEDGKDISKYMPEGDWHDLLEKEYYLFELLLGHDLNDLKVKAKSEDRLDDLVKAYYILNNSSTKHLASEYGPNTYLTNILKHNYRPTDKELDQLAIESIINKPKVHGEYCPNNIFYADQQIHVEHLSEAELYYVIKHYNDFKRYYNEDMLWIGSDSFTEEDKLYAKEYLMYQTKKFGVEFPKNDDNKPLEESESYKAWYRFYDNYYSSFKENIRDCMIFHISIYRAMKDDYSNFLPDGDWHDLLNIKETDLDKIAKK